MNNALTTQRIFSIDAFRGITILVMIFVNELAGVRNIPQWMKHMPADADAMTFVDVVFPAFLFIVGMSIPFALLNRKSKGDSLIKIQWHIIVRTLGLLVLGVFMVNAEGGYDEKAMGISIGLWMLLFYTCVILVWNVYTFKNVWIANALRITGVVGLIILGLIYKTTDGYGLSPQWWGILGLIGWAYLISCMLYQLLQGNKYSILIAAILCVAVYALENSGTENSILMWISSQRGHAIHTAIVLFGMVTSLIFFDKKTDLTLRRRFSEALGLVSFLGVIGFLLRPYFFISKIYATPTWCVYCALICIIIFSLLYWIIDLKKHSTWARFFKPAASNPLLTYIIPYIVLAFLMVTHITLPASLHDGIAGIVWSMAYAISIMVFVILLNKWKIRLQL